MSAPQSSYTKFQRIMAMLGAILLLALTACSLLFRIITFPGSDRLAMAFMIAAIFIPILIWVWIWIYGQLRHKKTIATIFPDRYDEPSDTTLDTCKTANSDSEDASGSDATGSDATSSDASDSDATSSDASGSDAT